jgi:hypothetical protein
MSANFPGGTAADNDRLHGSHVLIQAIEFAAVADAHASHSERPSWFVLNFQLGRSAELALKAHALSVGATEKELRGLGHDLEAALAFVIERGFKFELAPAERENFAILNHWYRRKLLEYPLVQGYVAPNMRTVRVLVDRVLAAVFVAMWGEAQYRHDRERTQGMSIDAATRYD